MSGPVATATLAAVAGITLTDAAAACSSSEAAQHPAELKMNNDLCLYYGGFRTLGETPPDLLSHLPLLFPFFIVLFEEAEVAIYS